MKFRAGAVARAKCGGGPECGRKQYLLIPASMRTSLREPHTHFHARMPWVWLLIFLVLFVSRQKEQRVHSYLGVDGSYFRPRYFDSQDMYGRYFHIRAIEI